MKEKRSRSLSAHLPLDEANTLGGEEILNRVRLVKNPDTNESSSHLERKEKKK